MGYAVNAISTRDELLTSGFRPASRPDHTGCDFVDSKGQCNTPRGVDIIAIADGEVGEYINGSLVGQTVAIRHAGMILSRYQHMRNGSVLVRVGQKVAKGQVIGVMGNTGYVISSNASVPAQYRGTHLHIGIKENSTAYSNGTWVNPIPYMTGAKAIKGSGISIPVSPAVPPPSAPETGFAVGGYVRVKQTASKWATGQFIAAFVKGGRFKIVSVRQNQVCIENNGVALGWLYESDVEKA